MRSLLGLASLSLKVVCNHCQLSSGVVIVEIVIVVEVINVVAAVAIEASMSLYPVIVCHYLR